MARSACQLDVETSGLGAGVGFASVLYHQHHHQRQQQRVSDAWLVPYLRCQQGWVLAMGVDEFAHQTCSRRACVLEGLCTRSRCLWPAGLNLKEPGGASVALTC